MGHYRQIFAVSKNVADLPDSVYDCPQYVLRSLLQLAVIGREDER